MSELPSVIEFSADVSQQEAPKPLPVGQYRATVHHAEVRASKSSGKPMIALTYRISPDQYPMDYVEGNPDGELLSTFLSVEDTPRNRYRLRQWCEWHGVGAGRNVDVMAFLGQEVTVQITHEAYQGQDQARITVTGPA